MLVNFHSKAHGDVTMFGDVAVTLLKLAGLSGNVPTAILAADIPAALERLLAGLKEHGYTAPRPAAAEPRSGAAGRANAEEAERPVPLNHRARPLVDLLQAAQAAGADVLIRPR
ncbi:MAG TPA: DUF1840 domain-containing protein [Gammaproteobacteria bacterium]|nr:DUF1840 domain-containing protein [Gammaproteobacteria bacterium]